MSFDSLRNRATTLLAASAVLVIVAACGGGTTATNKPAATGTLRAAFADAVLQHRSRPHQHLVGPDGMTLYVFDKDTTPNKSACAAGQCLTAWPILTATGTPTAGAGVTGALATFARDDGATQVSYNGKPLYYFAADAKAGDTTGDGVGGIWHIAKP